MQPRLIIEQKITAFVNKYNVFSVDVPGNKAELRAHAQQKRLAFREKVTFYTDEQKSQAAFSFRAEKIMDVHGRYFVEDMNGVVVGILRKEFKRSLFVSSWVMTDANGNEVLRVKESNETVAILRRFAGFIPFVGDIMDFLMNFIKYHFSFIDVRSGREVGQYKKTTLLRDHYKLSVEDEAWALLDWRVFAAMSVALDALQSR